MWMGPVGFAETNSRLTLSLSVVRVAVGLPGVDHVLDDHVLSGGVEAQIDEAGARDIGGGDPVGLRQRGGEPAGQLARVHADLLAQLEGQIGGVVAVVGVTRALDGDRGG